MAYRTFVPMVNRQINENTREGYRDRLTKLGCTRLYIGFERAVMFMEEREPDLLLLRDNLKYFEDAGFEVVVWVQALGFGDPLSPDGEKMTAGFTRLRNSEGFYKGDAFCPEDERYMALYCGYIKDIIRVAHPKAIMIDDDLCLSARNELGCFCDRHVKLLSSSLGEEVSIEDFPKKAFTGKKNKYRSAWLSVMGDSLKKYCRTVREAVDEIDPEVRLGFCAGFTSWDIEGVDAIELTRILSGKHEPFLRLSGAPYWVAKDYRRFGGERLNSTIEFTRLQERICRDEGISCFAEADCYPRPRYHVPATLIECFDAAVHASGGMDDLVYALDYYSPVSYEEGYLKHHLKNEGLGRFIEENFGDKVCFGVKVYESINKFAEETLPDTLSDPFLLSQRYSLSSASNIVTTHSLPTTYEDESEIGVAFGKNASFIGKLPKKLIIDFKAAIALMEKGIDVGVKSYDRAPVPSFEFRHGEKSLSFRSDGVFYNTVLKENATVESEFLAGHIGWEGSNRFNAAFRYDNGETEFLCFCFDGSTLDDASGAVLSYFRASELFDFAQGLPHIEKCPSVYQIAKRNDSETALFFANTNEDYMIDFEISLGEEYKSFKAFGIEGELCGDRFISHTDVPPYGMFALVLKK